MNPKLDKYKVNINPKLDKCKVNINLKLDEYKQILIFFITNLGILKQ